MSALPPPAIWRWIAAESALTDAANSAETAESLFTTLDEDGDGVISRDELHEGYVSYSALRGILGLPAV